MVTGANAGLGFEVAAVLAGAGARVVLACRHEGRASAAADAIRARHEGAAVETVIVDLADLASVRAAAAELRERFSHLDLLINNAGVLMTAPQRTVDGFELQLATNHLGHFALTGLLLDRLSATAGSRVVTVTSVGHVIGRLRTGNLDRTKRSTRVGAYAESKLANALFTFELADRLRAAGSPTTSLAAHPGSSDTDISRHIPRIRRALSPLSSVLQQSIAMGALPTLRAATDPEAENGDCYGPDGRLQWRGPPTRVRLARRAREPESRRRLWDESVRLTGVSYP